jgi:glucose/arabinose dehydrogenase
MRPLHVSQLIPSLLLLVAALLWAMPVGHISAAPGLALAPGFEEELVAEGLVEPTDVAFLPDGRGLVAEKAGRLRLVKDGALVPESVLDLTDRTNDFWERGLLGLAVDPRFTENGYVYVLYVAENDSTQYEGPKSSRLSRFTLAGDLAVPDSELVLLGSAGGAGCSGLPATADCLPAEYRSHSGGGLAFAADGSLFVGIGDAATESEFAASLRAQDLDMLGGKILRVSSVGMGLETNPYWTGDPAANRSKVWAYGFRNPFRLTVQPVTGIPFVGDVGLYGAEEIDATLAGSNHGWPCYEALERHQDYRAEARCAELYAGGPAAASWPLYSYPRETGSTTIGGAFVSGTAYPPPYEGSLFIADWSTGFIHALRLDDAHRVVEGPLQVARGLNGPVALELGPDGRVYVLSVTSGELTRLVYLGDVPNPATELPDDRFVARVFGNAALEGEPVASRLETVVQVERRADSPFPLTPDGSFSERWHGRPEFEDGVYAFELSVGASGSALVLLDGQLFLDAWSEGTARTRNATLELDEGQHELVVEYAQRGAEGTLSLTWHAPDSGSASGGGRRSVGLDSLASIVVQH